VSAGIYLAHHQHILERDTHRFDLAYRGPIAGALGALSKMSGAYFAFLSGEHTDVVEVDLRSVTLLDAVDRVLPARVREAT
jgi:hypothetical protein